MSDSAQILLLTPAEVVRPRGRARKALLKRLTDVACLPASRINAFERAMTADLLVELLGEATPEERERVARRLVGLLDIPGSLARLILRDDLPVAAILLEGAQALGEADLIDCARHASPEHRRLIARRRDVGEMTADALVAAGEAAVVEALLRNDLARLGGQTLESLVAMARDNPGLIPLLLRRAELRPGHACGLFWFADFEARKLILQRFAVSRDILLDAVDDLIAPAAEREGQDPLTRKALAFIARDQVDRAAIARGGFDSLEAAIAAAGTGLTRDLVEEISYLAGLKPVTGARIFNDAGGEALAVLCKASGLPRAAVATLWRGLGRPQADAAGAMAPALRQALTVFDMIATDRAQTVLRYWNWSSSPPVARAPSISTGEGDNAGLGEYSATRDGALATLRFGRSR